MNILELAMGRIEASPIVLAAVAKMPRLARMVPSHDRNPGETEEGSNAVR